MKGTTSFVVKSSRLKCSSPTSCPWIGRYLTSYFSSPSVESPLTLTVERSTHNSTSRLQHLRLRVTPAYAQIRHGELLTTAAQQANTPRHERARDRPPETLVLDGATWQPPESRRGSRGRLRAGVGGDVVEEVVVGDLAERRRVGGVDEGVQPEEDEVAVGRREVAHPLPLGPPGQLR